MLGSAKTAWRRARAAWPRCKWCAARAGGRVRWGQRVALPSAASTALCIGARHTHTPATAPNQSFQLEEKLERDAELEGMEAALTGMDGAGSKDASASAGGESEAGGQAGKAPSSAGKLRPSASQVAQMRCGALWDGRGCVAPDNQGREAHTRPTLRLPALTCPAALQAADQDRRQAAPHSQVRPGLLLRPGSPRTHAAAATACC